VTEEQRKPLRSASPLKYAEVQGRLRPEALLRRFVSAFVLQFRWARSAGCKLPSGLLADEGTGRPDRGGAALLFCLLHLGRAPACWRRSGGPSLARLMARNGIDGWRTPPTITQAVLAGFCPVNVRDGRPARNCSRTAHRLSGSPPLPL